MLPVLVVEDDTETREMLGDVLTDEGYPVILAADGPAALAHLQNIDQPLIVLVDQWMPGMAGADVIKTARRIGPASARAFILITASPAQVSALPADVPLIIKPFDLEVLLRAIAQAGAQLAGA